MVILGILAIAFGLAGIPVAALIASRGPRRKQMIRLAFAWPIFVVLMVILLEFGGNKLGASSYDSSPIARYHQGFSGGGGSW